MRRARSNATISGRTLSHEEIKELWAIDRSEVIDAVYQGLYISATPSEHTIRFYLRLGCQVSLEPDPELFELEQEDIHLELALA